jgi:hypothetical protein
VWGPATEVLVCLLLLIESWVGGSTSTTRAAYCINRRSSGIQMMATVGLASQREDSAMVLSVASRSADDQNRHGGLAPHSMSILAAAIIDGRLLLVSYGSKSKDSC